MDCFDPKASGLLPLIPDEGLGALAEPGPCLLPPDALPEDWGEVSILANLTGESSATRDLFAASTATTGSLAIGDSITGFVNALKDRDWFRLSLTAGEVYTFKLDAINGSRLDSLLSLRSSGGSLITSNDDSNGTLNSEIRWTASASGTYYLDAGAYNNRSTGQYQLSASRYIQPSGFNATSGYGEASVERAVESLLGTSLADVANQFSGGLYGLDRIGAPEVWAAGYRGEGMVVAVVDTGVDRQHVDLDANTWINTKEVAGDGLDNDGNGFVDDVYGWNFHDGTSNTLDNNNHGTHVAGTIAAEDNAIGVTGVANRAKIMAVKVLGANGSGSLSNVARGIRYAADNGANVINLSLGGSGSTELLSAVQYAWGKGAAVIMASGNDGALSPGYPAAYANQYGLAVGAIDANGAMASFSNRAGTTPLDYVTAAGVGVLSTIAGGGYASFSGTSMATPHMAGAMALLMQANTQSGQNRSLAQLETLFTSTASNSLTTTTASTTSSGGGTLSLSLRGRLRSFAMDEPLGSDQSALARSAEPGFRLPAESAQGAAADFDPASQLPARRAEGGIAAASVQAPLAESSAGAVEALSVPSAVATAWVEASSAAAEDAPILDPLTGLWARPWQLSA